MDRDLKPRRRSRSLTDEERKLWRAAMKDATPLKRGRKAEQAEDAPTQPASTQAAPASPTSAASAAIFVPPPKPGPPTVPPPLGPLERRTSQKLARGQIEIEAMIDLHGFSQERAHGALLEFIARSRGRGLRCVLVITGKGASPYARHTLHGSTFYEVPERQGVLRSAVPRWLGEAEFRLHVSGFQPAHPKHGGGGAFYLWLRKKR